MESSHELSPLSNISHFLSILSNSSELSIIGGCFDQGKAMRMKLTNGTSSVKFDIDFSCEENALGGVGSFLYYDSGSMIEDCYSTMVIGSFFMLDLFRLRGAGLVMDNNLPTAVTQHYDFFLRAKKLKLGVALCNNPSFNILNTGIHVSTMTSNSDARKSVWQPFMEKHKTKEYYYLSLCVMSNIHLALLMIALVFH